MTYTSGKCYYYKDFSDEKVRLIVLDYTHFDDEQNYGYNKFCHHQSPWGFPFYVHHIQLLAKLMLNNAHLQVRQDYYIMALEQKMLRQLYLNFNRMEENLLQ